MRAYKISIVSLPLALAPLRKATPKGHSITPRYAKTQAATLAECRKLVQDGYGAEVTAPNAHWDNAEVLRRLKLTTTYWMSRRAAPGASA